MRHDADLEAVHHTARLRIEPLVPAHAAELFMPLSDPALYRLIPERPPDSEAALRARFERLAARASADGRQRWLNWVLRADVPVGTLQATVEGDRADLAYIVFAAHQRRGYATEGARWLVTWLGGRGVRAVRATVDTRNAASIAVLQRLRFDLVSTGPSHDTDGAIDHVLERDLP